MHVIAVKAQQEQEKQQSVQPTAKHIYYLALA